MLTDIQGLLVSKQAKAALLRMSDKDSLKEHVYEILKGKGLEVNADMIVAVNSTLDLVSNMAKGFIEQLPYQDQ